MGKSLRQRNTGKSVRKIQKRKTQKRKTQKRRTVRKSKVGGGLSMLSIPIGLVAVAFVTAAAYNFWNRDLDEGPRRRGVGDGAITEDVIRALDADHPGQPAAAAAYAAASRFPVRRALDAANDMLFPPEDRKELPGKAALMRELKEKRSAAGAAAAASYPVVD